MKLLTIIGTRPQLIKVPPKIKGQKIVWTGQHYDKELSKVLDIKIDYQLKETTLGGMIDKLLDIMIQEKPRYVMVVGDCRTTVAGALAAHQLHIPIIHLEAGSRSGNLSMIEERNRILVDSLTDIYFCPSLNTMDNLIKEGFGGKTMYNTGASQISSMVQMTPTVQKYKHPYDILTLHRDFNVDNKQRLNAILREVGKSKKKIYFPIHPRTKTRIKEFGIEMPKNIKVIKSQPYKEMISLIAYADRCITDSGGLQAEAAYLRTFCITLREDTEWGETVEEGWNVLVGSDMKKLREAIETFGVNKEPYWSRPYGYGQTQTLIKNIIERL